MNAASLIAIILTLMSFTYQETLGVDVLRTILISIVFTLYAYYEVKKNYYKDIFAAILVVLPSLAPFEISIAVYPLVFSGIFLFKESKGIYNSLILGLVFVFSSYTFILDTSSLIERHRDILLLGTILAAVSILSRKEHSKSTGLLFLMAIILNSHLVMDTSFFILFLLILSMFYKKSYSYLVIALLTLAGLSSDQSIYWICSIMCLNIVSLDKSKYMLRNEYIYFFPFILFLFNNTFSKDIFLIGFCLTIIFYLIKKKEVIYD